MFKDFYFRDKLEKNNHNIDLRSFFSENKIKLNLEITSMEKKSLDIEFPQIDSNIKVSFNPTSSLEGVKGKSKIKLFDNI